MVERGTTIARFEVMLTKRLASTALASALAIAVASGCATDSGGVGPDASLLVVNDSDFAIYEIYLTEIDNPDWGPNLLRGDILLPDEDLLLGVDCDFYDALLVDEDDVECEIRDIDLCLNDATWVIRNNTCAVFEAAAKARAETAAEKATTKTAN